MLIVSLVSRTGITQRHRFSSLEEMAEHSLSRRTPEKSCCPDIDDLLRASLERTGVKDRLQIEKYLLMVRQARERWELFVSMRPEQPACLSWQETLHRPSPHATSAIPIGSSTAPKPS